MVTSTEFDTLVDRRAFGTPLGLGWCIYEVTCPHCGFGWTEIAIAGTEGMKCLDCGYIDPYWAWRTLEDDPPHDGGWLEPVGWEKASFIAWN